MATEILNLRAQLAVSEPTLITKAMLPKVDFQDIQHAWFRYFGRVYSVATASTAIFRAAVLQKAPNWRFHDEYGPVLCQHELDLCDRWWLLCCLADSHREITLYESREQAASLQEA